MLASHRGHRESTMAAGYCCPISSLPNLPPFMVSCSCQLSCLGSWVPISVIDMRLLLHSRWLFLLSRKTTGSEATHKSMSRFWVMPKHVGRCFNSRLFRIMLGLHHILASPGYSPITKFVKICVCGLKAN